MTQPPSLEQRITHLERSLRRARSTAAVLAISGLAILTAASSRQQSQVSDEVRTRRLVVVDDSGRVRVRISQDPARTQRMSRAAGLIVFDDKGHERGGFSTMDDGSVVIGLDAPVGVGAPMRDRIGLKVFPDGSSYVMLINNRTGAVARLISEERAGGTQGMQVFKWDGTRPYIRTIAYDGDLRDSTPR